MLMKGKAVCKESYILVLKKVALKKKKKKVMFHSNEDSERNTSTILGTFQKLNTSYLIVNNSNTE